MHSRLLRAMVRDKTHEASMTELLQAEFIGCRQAQSLTYSDAHDRMVWTITERFSPSRTTNEYMHFGL